MDETGVHSHLNANKPTTSGKGVASYASKPNASQTNPNETPTAETTSLQTPPTNTPPSEFSATNSSTPQTVASETSPPQTVAGETAYPVSSDNVEERSIHSTDSSSDSEVESDHVDVFDGAGSSTVASTTTAAAGSSTVASTTGQAARSSTSVRSRGRPRKETVIAEAPPTSRGKSRKESSAPKAPPKLRGRPRKNLHGVEYIIFSAAAFTTCSFWTHAKTRDSILLASRSAPGRMYHIIYEFMK
ncbi:hypothetical protein RND71_009952 [Anisodus tanguticus]|uniref:Uncharacterized protein n=1 Tax=Anisodus tanguticus TaxID=243964 RepID=A0AAE1VIN9_9SOLA|nr:hypothetical protein RND71_009952 [Anisodus tanguticus]